MNWLPQMKLSDAVIAATSIYLNTPLYAYDKDFKKLQNEADIVLIL
jgi:PIN domain.